MTAETPKSEEVDVAIFGAGPAGCAAARTLAREKGRSVALIDRAATSHRQAGETLPPGARDSLKSLGLWERFAGAGHLPSPGVVSTWGGEEPVETDFLFHPHGCGWHLDRAAFGRMLLDSAQEAGARLLTGIRLLGAERLRGQGWEISLGPGDESRGASMRLRARLIIIATGRSLPSELPLPPDVRERITLDRLVAVAAHHVDVEDSDPRLQLAATPGGWWYVAPLPRNAQTAVFLTDADLVRAAGGASTSWREALPHAPFASRPPSSHSSLRTLAAQSYCRRAVAGSDFLLAGDAACAWDPLTGHGLRRALEEGRDAALAASDRLETKSDGPLRAYAARVRDSWGTYIQRRAEVYGAERRWKREPFWHRRHI
jgi:flavin-dependent dehydrogenase